MANLYLTHRCERGCPYCFARNVLKEAGNNLDEILTIEEIEAFIEHYGNTIDGLGILGGEPFLYPYFRELIQLLFSKGVFAKIFTSATNPLPEVLEEMDIATVRNKMCFVVNIGRRDTYSDKKFVNLEYFLRKFSELSSLSLTIFDLTADSSYLIDVIDKYNLNRNIRVGIALPILNGGNQYIPVDLYKDAGEYFMNFAELAAQHHVSLSMDCGFIACMFSTEQIGRLYRLGTAINFRCEAACDIGPGLQAWNCFPLFQVGRVDAMLDDSIKELMLRLIRSTDEHLGNSCGILLECKDCNLMNKGLCHGGCKSFKSIIQ